MLEGNAEMLPLVCLQQAEHGRSRRFQKDVIKSVLEFFLYVSDSQYRFSVPRCLVTTAHTQYQKRTSPALSDPSP